MFLFFPEFHPYPISPSPPICATFEATLGSGLSFPQPFLPCGTEKPSTRLRIQARYASFPPFSYPCPCVLTREKGEEGDTKYFRFEFPSPPDMTALGSRG